MPFLSIVTPSYNRAHLLGDCYGSLLRQTDKDFEWIVVDDGSRDNTAEVVKAFACPDFPIRFISKENGGKHTALNAAMEHIRGQYVLILDSDDTLTENAVALVREHWNRYAGLHEIGILTFLKGHSPAVPVCTVVDYDMPVDILRYKRNSITGSDCCEVIRAELFCQHPFPVFEGERFLSECALWNRVALTHKCVYINEIIYLCEYLEDGLTKAGRGLRIRNPKGGMFICDLRMGRKNYLSQRIKYGLLYVCYAFFAGISPKDVLKKENSRIKRLCLIPGYFLYRYWKFKYMK